jgi:hypothetical protein
MKVAIMQPYFFPYIGYFSLIKVVDLFIFYDDVNYIKGGWVNRNRILINSEAKYLTLNVKNGSPNKLINEIEFDDNRQKLLKTIEQNYKKAPYFKQVWPLLETNLKLKTTSLADIAINSVRSVTNYLGMKTKFEISSVSYPETKGLERSDRLKQICRKTHADTYINAIGGIDLYDKNDFLKNHINLQFLKPQLLQYKQYKETFIPGLSIIDVLMFNSIEDINKMLDQYQLA